MPDLKKTYSLNIDYETIEIPPVSDILVLGKKYPQGKQGIVEAFKFIAPDDFEMFDNICDGAVEAILINTRILKRIPSEDVIKILKKYVFPNVSSGEAIKVDFHFKVSVTNIKGDIL